MSAEDASPVSQWRAHLAGVRATIDAAPAPDGAPHAAMLPPAAALPPLPAELAHEAAEVLASLRARAAVARAERDRIGRELEQLRQPPRAHPASRPVYLDAIG